MNLKTEEINHADALLQLKTDWQALFFASNAVPFLSWEWISSWHQFLAPQITPKIICVRDQKQLLGLLALGEERIGLGVSTVTRFSLLGANHGGADYLGVLAREGYEEVVTDTIFKHLAAKQDGEGVILEEVAMDSGLLSAAERTFRRSPQTMIKITPRYHCPQIELNADWETILKRSRRADNFKRRLRQLSQKIGFEYRRVTEPSEIEPAYTRFLKMHEARWKSAGGSDAIGSAALLQFHREVTKSLAVIGKVSFEELWCEGKCRATIYGLEHKGRFYYFNAGYDMEWARHSVGLVLLGLSIQNSINRRIKVYDFLRGTESYKSDWATSARETVTLQITDQHWPTRLYLGFEELQAKFKATSQKYLPTKCWQGLRSLKRQYLLGR